MVASRSYTRVDTLELKDLIYQKIGLQRAEKYFDHLNRFLGSKLSKSDFDKSCLQTIGRENIYLHNRLIRSILQNACLAKIPPQKPRKVNYQKTPLQSIYSDAFPQSPRKCRSPINRKFRDRPSPLGPLGKSSSITYEETLTRIQGPQSASEFHSLCSKPPVEDGEEVEQFSSASPTVSRWDSISAPLDVCLEKGSSCKSLYGDFSFNGLTETCQSRGELPDTRSLQSRLEKKLAMEGVGISMDCCDLLNKSLDVFLKRLIEPCVGFGGPGSVNIQDFCAAMESNPRLLGENQSIQMEKISYRAFQE